MAEKVPDSVNGWQVADVPLGATEAASGIVADVLRYDDYVFRRYSHGTREFSVYVAYWAPGKMPTRLVAEHTPDRCWIGNGWMCNQRSRTGEYLINGKRLPEAEKRQFSAPGLGGGAVQHVLFWLMVDGQAYDAHANFIGHAITWWRDALFESSARGQGEKFFVRISSSEPFEQLWSDEAFQVVMGKVADFGVWDASR